MTPKERLAEACDLLALGLIRLRARQSSELSPDLGESSLHIPPAPERSCKTSTTESRMTDTIPARLAALKTMPMPDLKAQWRELFETEPPPFNRRYLENRLAYRIQELAYGGLKPETLRAAGSARRAVRQRHQPPSAERRQAGHRHPAGPRVSRASSTR